MKFAPGMRAAIASARLRTEQESLVLPRTCSSGREHMARSGSAASCTSSIARKSTSASRGMASTVHTKYRARSGLIFSSPVMSATESAPTRATTLS